MFKIFKSFREKPFKSLGEAYSPVMAILPMAYRIWQSPETLYDGMIYISKAHPTKIMPEQ